VEAMANDIVASGGVAETATVDALKRKMEVDMRKLIAGMKISVDGM
jgi:phosphoribosylformimino-5-aminoimidazole carboxamide ribonucleotide (ProFAR) isomerase